MSYTSQCTVMSKIWETEVNFFDISWWHQPVEISFPTLSNISHNILVFNSTCIFDDFIYYPFYCILNHLLCPESVSNAITCNLYTKKVTFKWKPKNHENNFFMIESFWKLLLIPDHKANRNIICQPYGM